MLQLLFLTSLLQWLVEYNAALASVCFMVLLGFIDDVLDVPWRVYVVFHNAFQFTPMMYYYLPFYDNNIILEWSVFNRKLLLPTIAALPLLMAYVGGTSISIPKPLTSYVGVAVLELGMLISPK